MLGDNKFAWSASILKKLFSTSSEYKWYKYTYNCTSWFCRNINIWQTFYNIAYTKFLINRCLLVVIDSLKNLWVPQFQSERSVNNKNDLKYFRISFSVTHPIIRIEALVHACSKVSTYGGQKSGFNDCKLITNCWIKVESFSVARKLLFWVSSISCFTLN